MVIVWPYARILGTFNMYQDFQFDLKIMWFKSIFSISIICIYLGKAVLLWSWLCSPSIALLTITQSLCPLRGPRLLSVGSGHLTIMMLDVLQAQSNPCTSTARTTVDCPQPKRIPKSQLRLENTTATSSLTPAPEPRTAVSHFGTQKSKQFF